MAETGESGNSGLEKFFLCVDALERPVVVVKSIHSLTDFACPGVACSSPSRRSQRPRWTVTGCRNWRCRIILRRVDNKHVVGGLDVKGSHLCLVEELWDQGQGYTYICKELAKLVSQSQGWTNPYHASRLSPSTMKCPIKARRHWVFTEQSWRNQRDSLFWLAR